MKINIENFNTDICNEPIYGSEQAQLPHIKGTGTVKIVKWDQEGYAKGNTANTMQKRKLMNCCKSGLKLPCMTRAFRLMRHSRLCIKNVRKHAE